MKYLIAALASGALLAVAGAASAAEVFRLRRPLNCKGTSAPMVPTRSAGCARS